MYLDEKNELFGVFAKFRKTAVSFVMSVCLSGHPHGTTGLPLDGFFIQFDIHVFFRKAVVKIQVLLKSDKENEYFSFHVCLEN